MIEYSNIVYLKQFERKLLFLTNVFIYEPDVPFSTLRRDVQDLISEICIIFSRV
jgi:hypothetical protein